MAASAELLLATTAPLPRLPRLTERAEDGDPSKRLLMSLLPSPDSPAEGAGSADYAEAPLTSEPPLADVAPLTSEPPLGAELPLTSEPTGTGLFSDGRGASETLDY